MLDATTGAARGQLTIPASDDGTLDAVRFAGELDTEYADRAITLPTFLVIGAAKGGTTSLHHYLREHPQIFVPAVKETNYFWTEAAKEGRRTPQTLAAYERCFAGAGAHTAIGEVSPRYLNSPGAAQKISSELADVRLVVSLRDPAERAWSDYLGRVRILRESRPFAAAVQPGEPCFEWGLYHERLARFYALFDAEQIHVILHEELAADTPATMRKLFSFLGVESEISVDASRRHNVAAAPRSRALNRVLWPAIGTASRLMPRGWRGSGIAERALARSYRPAPSCPEDILRELQQRYVEDVQRTGSLIGRDLSHWGVMTSRPRTSP